VCGISLAQLALRFGKHFIYLKSKSLSKKILKLSLSNQNCLLNISKALRLPGHNNKYVEKQNRETGVAARLRPQ
jgi:hypothetical protein